MRYLLILLVLLTGCGPAYERFSAQYIGMFDTLIVFSGYAESEEAFAGHAEALFSRFEELHRLYDIFNAYDGINNIHTINANAGIAPVEVHQDIIGLLLAAREGYYMTGGTVNIALGPVLRLWRDDVEPSEEALKAAGRLSDISYMTIDEVNNTVFLEKAGMSLDVGAIAKGFAAALAMEAARGAGAEAALLNAGGHIVAVGTPPGRDFWNIGIRGTEDVLHTTDTTVSAAGGEFRAGHIIDPATLRPATRFYQVTVVHPTSWVADVLATALFILPQEEGEILYTSPAGTCTVPHIFWDYLRVPPESRPRLPYPSRVR